MAQLGFNLGKEVWQGIVAGLVAIAICVSIGSVIAQAMSHGPEQAHGADEAHAPEAGTPEAAAAADTTDVEDEAPKAGEPANP